MNPKFFRNGIVMLALVVVALAVVVTLVTQSSPANNMDYSVFLDEVSQGNVSVGPPGRWDADRQGEPTERRTRSSSRDSLQTRSCRT